jgi:ubiquinone/menaquinone biosynthesis C-methylase UbiE
MTQRQPWEQWQLGSNTAEEYEQYLVPAVFGPWASRLLGLAGLQPGERVLDVACGTGLVARRAAQQVGSSGKVVGVDLNPAMLAIARTLPSMPGGVIEWWEGDVLALPFPEAAFDVVCCQNGLQYFPDREAALQEMYRVVAPAGRLAVLVWRAIEHSPGYAVLAEVLARHVSQAAAMIMRAPFALSDAEELRTLIARAGFRDVVVRVEAGIVRFPSPEEFVRQQVAGSPLREPVSAVNEEVRKALIRDVGDALQAYVQADGLTFPIEAHLAVARK